MANLVSWQHKDADEAINYSLPWANQLAPGDTVVSSVWEATGVTVGDPTILSDGLTTRALISGGTNGDVAMLQNTVVTAQGETLELAVALPIIASTPPALGPYEMPRAQDLVTRYPAFAAVPYSTIAIHLRDALTGVDTSWAVADYEPALSSLAAHNMALLGLGVTDETTGYARKGITSVKDGAFSVSFSDRAVADASGGGFSATHYGRLYAVLLKRNRGGPRVIGAGAGLGGWGPLGQLNNGGIVPWAY